MSMDPNAALWTLALYAGEPDPRDPWEMDDGTPVDIGACVLALVGALSEVERLRKLHTWSVADGVRAADELAEECDRADRAEAEVERLRPLADAAELARDLVGDLVSPRASEGVCSCAQPTVFGDDGLCLLCGWACMGHGEQP